MHSYLVRHIFGPCAALLGVITRRSIVGLLGSRLLHMPAGAMTMMMMLAQSMMSGMGLGMVVDQLADLKLGELLDTPPPGLDEAVAIAKA